VSPIFPGGKKITVKKKISMKVGMIGAGSWARRHLESWKQSGAEVVAIYNRTRSRAEKLAEEFKIPEFYTDADPVINHDDVDIISISMPHNIHYELSNAAVAAGKHVYCEKPLAMDYDQARDMYERANQAGVKTGMQFNPRTDPVLVKIDELIRDGYLGTVQHIDLNIATDYGADPQLPMSWRFQQAVAGTGALGDLGVYAIDSARWLVGEFHSVSGLMWTDIKERPVIPEQYDFFETLAMARKHNVPQTGEVAQVDNDDEAIFLARFENGATGLFKASRVNSDPKTRISGSNGVLYRDFERDLLMGKHPGDRAFSEIAVPERDPEETIVSQFMRNLRDDTDLGPTYYDGMKNQAVIDAVARSSAEKCWVDLAAIENA